VEKMNMVAVGLTLLAVAAMCVLVARAPAAQTTAGGTVTTERPPIWPFVVAVVIPVVGFVLGAIEAAKRSGGRGAAIMALSLVAGFGWYSVLLTSTGQDRCVVTALGGNKLCGDDARAWCDSTDALRAAANDARSQQVCDDLRR
jgi:FtsH-binding integral membrane protein